VGSIQGLLKNDLHFGRQKQNLVAQATILVDNIEP
jgi:hypothetical protein